MNLGVVFLLLQFGWLVMSDHSVFMDIYDYDNGDMNGGQDTAYISTLITVPKEETYGSALNCKVNNPGPTDDVNKLSPFNVGVVAALGDSLTAALGAGAKYFWESAREYKGISWSIGGRSTLSRITTLPNILKEFNSNIYGFSSHKKWYKQTEAFNRAISGAHVKDLLGEAQDLVHQMKIMQQMGKWKVITIFIGSNDLCDRSTCSNEESTTVKHFMHDLHKALRYLSKNVKFAFINLALLLDVSILAPVRGFCDVVHYFTCSCAVKTDPNKASRVAKAINSAIVQQFQKEQPYDRKDFAIVVQPLYSNTKLPYKTKKSWWVKKKSQAKIQWWRRRRLIKVPDKSYFAPDCFHFNQKAHTLSATLLWNNMLQPVGKKTKRIQWEQERKLICPNIESPYFRTNSNSKLTG